MLIKNISDAQKRILYTELKYENPSLSNIGGFYTIESSIDSNRMRKVILDILNTEAIFQVKFIEQTNDIQQVIDEQRIYLEEDIPIIYDEKDFYEKKNQFFKTKFNIFQSKLCKFLIFSTLEHSELVILFHHSIMDAYSIGLFAGKVFTHYEEEIQEKKAVDYFDFLLEEETYKNSSKYEVDKSYWIKRYKAFDGELFEYPTDTTAASYVSKMSPPFKKELDAYFKRNKLNPNIFFITLLTVFQYKYLGIDSSVLGIPYYNRRNKDYLSTYGMFVSTIPYLFKIEGNETFKQIYELTKKNFIQDIRHARFPYNEIVNTIGTGSQSLFSWSFNYYVNNMDYTIQKNSVGVHENTPTQLASYLNIIYRGFTDQSDELELVYCKEVYTEEQIRNLVERLHIFLSKVMDSSIDTEIAKVDLLTDSQRIKIVTEQNKYLSKKIPETGLKAMFREIVSLFPDVTAIESDDKKISYSELDHLSNEYCLKLMSRGIKNCDRVAIIANKEIEVFTWLVAMMKMSVTYVPIDPDYPVSRREYILMDSDVKLLIEDSELKDNQFFGQKQSSHVEKDNFSNRKADDALYILYTSGTTGNPKGVEIPEKGITRLVAKNTQIDYQKIDYFLQLNSLSFDISALEIWGALINGKTLKIITRSQLLNPEQLSEKLNQMNGKFGSILSVTLLSELIKSDKKILNNAAFIITGGELVGSQLICEIYEQYQDITLLNGYGPTENSVLSTLFNIPREISKTDLISIGTPIDRSSVYILDKDNNICCPNQIGEVVVGGTGVANQYLNLEESTKAKFLCLKSLNNERLYRTGDLGWYSANQQLFILGRQDNQVKINGQRIELGEIEQVVNDYPKVDTSVVQIFENSIVCFYTGADIDADALMLFISKRLTATMLPKLFCRIEGMPYNINGKLDKKVLSAIYFREKQKLFAQPICEAVNPILSKGLLEILNSSKIDPEKSFIENGGDSFLAMKLNNLLKNHSIAPIPINLLLGDEALNQVNKFIKPLNQSKNIKIAIKNSENAQQSASSAQKRIFVTEKFKHEKNLFNAPIVLKVTNCFNRSELKNKIQKFINMHRILKTKFSLSAKGILIHFVPQNLTVKEIDSDKSSIDEVLRENLTDFDIEKQVFECKFISLSAGAYYILFDFHHIIFDGESKEIFLRELKNYLNGNEQLPETDYLDILSEINQEEELKSQEEFWQTRVSSLKNTDKRLLDRSIESKVGNVLKLISDTELNFINVVTKGYNTTPNILFSSLIALLECNKQGNLTPTVGIPVSTRDNLSKENIIGLFLNTIPISFEIRPDETVEKYIQRYKSDFFEILENSSYPFEKIDSLYKAYSGLQAQTLIETMFVYNKETTRTFLLQDETVFRVYDYQNSVQAKYPLSIVITEGKQEMSINIEFDQNQYTEKQIAEYLIKLKEMIVCIAQDKRLKIENLIK